MKTKEEIFKEEMAKEFKKNEMPLDAIYRAMDIYASQFMNLVKCYNCNGDGVVSNTTCINCNGIGKIVLLPMKQNT